MDLRGTAREIFLDTLRRCEVRSVLRDRLVRQGSEIRIGDLRYDLDAFSGIVIIAVGKAATSMADGLLEALKGVIAPETLEGLVIGSHLPSKMDPRLQYRIGGHPLPDSASQHAAADVLALLRRCHAGTLVIFLISGGSSAMLEAPVDPSLSFEQLVAFHRTLVHSGLEIAEMNVLRKHVSAVKGGRLAVAAGAATMCTLLISDVQPDAPEVIGSGPSLPDASTVEHCRALLAGKLRHAEIAPEIRRWFAREDCPETPKPGDPAFRNARSHTLLSSDDLCAAASEAARARGFRATIDLRCDEWDYARAAEYLLEHLQALAQSTQPVCLISAGELAVHIDVLPGTGGRNQQFALHCAQRIAGSYPCLAVLSAGSDGVDGNSPAAGAVVDCGTARRAQLRGFDPAEALAQFDAYPLLSAAGDAIHLGPSENNLRDLRLLLMNPAS